MTSMMPKRALPATLADVPTTSPRRAKAAASAPLAAAVAPLALADQAAATLPVWGRAHQWTKLSSEMAARVTANALGAMATLPPRMASDPQLWHDMLALNQATVDRILALQAEGHAGYAQWMVEASQLRQAQTLSTLLLQEGNLLAQLGSLMEDQLSNWIGLMENLQVDYGYWVAQQQQGRTVDACDVKQPGVSDRTR